MPDFEGTNIERWMSNMHRVVRYKHWKFAWVQEHEVYTDKRVVEIADL